MRALLMVASVAVAGLLALPSQASAAGGLYNVVKCHPWNPDANEVQEAGGHPSYWKLDNCHATATDPRMGVYNMGASGNNAYYQLMLTAPPGTHLETACLDYNLRRENHHRAELLAYPGFDLLASGGEGPTGWTNRCFDLNDAQLILRMSCSQTGGCPEGLNAHAFWRNIVVAVSDDSDPAITGVGGDLTDSGWLRGTKTLIASAQDGQSGTLHLLGYVNGSTVGRVNPLCDTGGLGWNYSARFPPCPTGSVTLGAQINTAAAPFVNGPNRLDVSVSDYGANADFATRTILVDNLPPKAAFALAQRPDDPEVVRATVTDAHSGVRAAEIQLRAVGAEAWQPLQTDVFGDQARARVNSSAVPAGEYEFKAIVEDTAGNLSETTLREDGSRMRLTFPLRSPVELRTALGQGAGVSQTVPYGTSSTVRGRLLDSHGEPLPNQEVTVVDRFDGGALYPRVERRTVTDAHGRFSSPVPAGPTRSIEATFAGTDRYLPAEDEVGKFTVRGAASFRPSTDVIEEGNVIAFHGKVRHRGARIPAGGKLVEVQYRLKTGRQRTLKEPFRTRPDGKYRLKYRFSKSLTSDALFHFRVKVRGEGNWPFKGVASKWSEVTVHAR